MMAMMKTGRRPKMLEKETKFGWKTVRNQMSQLHSPVDTQIDGDDGEPKLMTYLSRTAEIQYQPKMSQCRNYEGP